MAEGRSSRATARRCVKWRSWRRLIHRVS